MNLSRGERERLKGLFNIFLAAQRRCSDTTEIGRLKKHVYGSLAIMAGFVLGDDPNFETNINLWVQEIKSFGAITEKELDPERN